MVTQTFCPTLLCPLQGLTSMATQRPFTHSDDVDVYFVGAPDLRPRLANSVPPMPISAPLSLLDSPRIPQDQPSNRPVLPSVPLTERDLGDFRCLGSIHVVADATPLSPVCPIPISECISERTRSRTA